jgi:hypothetical protein
MTSEPSRSALCEVMLAEKQLGIFPPLVVSAEAFAAAYEAPIGDHVEQNYKGLSYLSWPFAYRYMKQHFPTLFVSFEEAQDGWPVFGQEGCWLLRPFLTDGTQRTPALVFPLMDNKHNALTKLDARAVSDNMQRASVKAIATFTGLGLKLYAGEDVPKQSDEAPAADAPAKGTRRPRAEAAATAATAPAAPEPAPEAPAAAPAAAPAFDGKTMLLTVCKANPLQYADERASLLQGKAALQQHGMNKGDDIKNRESFADVATTMIVQWAKAESLSIDAAAMKTSMAKFRAICMEGTADHVIAAMVAFKEGKQ